MKSYDREVVLSGAISRSSEGKTWRLLGEWAENQDYYVVDMINPRGKYKLKLMEKRGYERVRCYPTNIPIYIPFVNPECVLTIQ